MLCFGDRNIDGNEAVVSILELYTLSCCTNDILQVIDTTFVLLTCFCIAADGPLLSSAQMLDIEAEYEII